VGLGVGLPLTEGHCSSEQLRAREGSCLAREPRTTRGVPRRPQRSPLLRRAGAPQAARRRWVAVL